eukprot:gene4502-8954_t
MYEILGFDDYGTTILSTSTTSPYLFNLIGVQSTRLTRDINTFGKRLNSQARTFAKKGGGVAKSIH